MIQTLNNENFEQFINSNETVLVDFYADWCAPCRMVAPLLEKAEITNPGKIGKVNVDDNSELASKFAIRSIPTIITFKNGMIVDKKIGALKNVDEVLQLL